MTVLAVDVLSDVLRVVRLTGAVYFDVHTRTPWIVETPGAATIRAGVMPEFEHVIPFHVMLAGSGWGQLADESQPAIRLAAGDTVIFAHGDHHFLGSEPGKRSVPDPQLYHCPKDRPLPFVLSEFGGNGEAAHFACGFLGCDTRPYNPIVAALPSVLHVSGSGQCGNLIFDLMRVALEETRSPRAGGEAFLAKVSELMFLHAVRHHIDALPAHSTGWLAAFRDSHVGMALRAMHARPSEPWTLAGLAHETGLSRTAFAERFTEMLGTSAMQYLSNWRLQLATELLDRGGGSLAEVAKAVGYESEAAFNRAFKRQVGMPPGAWRRQARGAITWPRINFRNTGCWKGW